MTIQGSDTQKFYGWKNAVVLFFLYFCLLGIVFYGFSVIFPQMVKAMGWSRGQAALPHSLRAIMVGILTPLVSVAINKIGSKRTFLIGLVISLIALILLGTATTEFWHWAVIWGLIMPFGFALAGQLNVQTTTLYWFNKRRATAMGFVMSGAAVAGFLASPALTWLMKQTNSWQSGWIACAGVILVSIIALHWLINKPSDIDQFADGVHPDEAASQTDPSQSPQQTYRTTENWELKEAMRTRIVWLDVVVLSALYMSLYLLLVHGVFHLTDLGYSQMNAASGISAILIGGVLSRLPMGVVGDRVEPRWLLTFAFCLMLPSMLAFWKAPSLTFLLAAGFGFGFGFGTVITINPILLGNYFSPAAFASINGFVQPLTLPFAAVVPFAAGYLKDYSGSYDLAFIVIGTVLFTAGVAATLMAPPVKAVEVLAESNSFSS